MRHKHLWQAGFTLPALSQITHMSGLVDIVGVHWEPEPGVLIFTVDRKFEYLFRQGSLRGNYVGAAKLVKQPLLVDLVGTDNTLQV